MLELSCALVLIGLIARDALRVWLKHKASTAASHARLEALEAALGGVQDRTDNAIKMLAEDFKKKLVQMEKDNKDMQRHIDSQVAGTIAQLPQTGKGWGR